jgi:hypothetical protein
LVQFIWTFSLCSENFSFTVFYSISVLFLSISPIIAFYADLPVPPQVAVLSSKRFSSNHITLDDIQSVLQNYRPDQIVLARWKDKFTSHQGIKNYLDENYRKIYPSKNTDKEVPFEQYVLKR